MYYFHNPYTLPYLAFYTKEKDEPKHHFLAPSNQATTNYYGSNVDYHLITSVDLHTQTEDPIISLIVTTPITIFFAASAVFIQSRTLQMLKHESGVNNRLMTTQAKIYMIYWPVLVLMNAIITNIYPLSTFTTPYLCTVLSFFLNFCAQSLILYTFYACLLRYLFCIHAEKVERFGKYKMIGLVYWIFYAHIFIWVVFTMLTGFNLDNSHLINKCYGWMDRLYLLELNDATNTWKRFFCAMNSGDGKKIDFKMIY